MGWGHESSCTPFKLVTRATPGWLTPLVAFIFLILTDNVLVMWYRVTQSEIENMEYMYAI